MAPSSGALITIEGSLLILSISLTPLSTVDKMVSGAGARMSSTKLKLVLPDTLPAASVWFTSTSFAPSTAAKLVVQAPALLLYATVAAVESVVSKPLLVTKSSLRSPLSVLSFTRGAAGGTVSKVKLKSLTETLPPMLVWRILTV